MTNLLRGRNWVSGLLIKRLVYYYIHTAVQRDEVIALIFISMENMKYV